MFFLCRSSVILLVVMPFPFIGGVLVISVTLHVPCGGAEGRH